MKGVLILAVVVVAVVTAPVLAQEETRGYYTSPYLRWVTLGWECITHGAIFGYTAGAAAHRDRLIANLIAASGVRTLSDVIGRYRSTSLSGHGVSVESRQTLSMYWLVYCCSTRWKKYAPFFVTA